MKPESTNTSADPIDPSDRETGAQRTGDSESDHPGAKVGFAGFAERLRGDGGPFWSSLRVVQFFVAWLGLSLVAYVPVLLVGTRSVVVWGLWCLCPYLFLALALVVRSVWVNVAVVIAFYCPLLVFLAWRTHDLAALGRIAAWVVVHATAQGAVAALAVRNFPTPLTFGWEFIATILGARREVYRQELRRRERASRARELD